MLSLHVVEWKVLIVQQPSVCSLQQNHWCQCAGTNFAFVLTHTLSSTPKCVQNCHRVKESRSYIIVRKNVVNHRIECLNPNRLLYCSTQHSSGELRGPQCTPVSRWEGFGLFYASEGQRETSHAAPHPDRGPGQGGGQPDGGPHTGGLQKTLSISQTNPSHMKPFLCYDFLSPSVSHLQGSEEMKLKPQHISTLVVSLADFVRMADRKIIASTLSQLKLELDFDSTAISQLQVVLFGFQDAVSVEHKTVPEADKWLHEGLQSHISLLIFLSSSLKSLLLLIFFTPLAVTCSRSLATPLASA